MPKKINIKGVIIPNNYAFFYKWFGLDCACPADVEKALNEANGGDVEVYINSPGGIIDVGSEIYTMLRAYKGDVKMYIVGEACSAASVIAMARYCEMSPTALMMVHCVSTGNYGNHAVFEHTAEVLRTADEALCTAYMQKAGMTKEEALAMMNYETWMNAEKAKEKGLIDAIMFEQKEPFRLVASTFSLPSAEQLEKVKNLIKEQAEPAGDDGTTDDDKSAFLMQAAKAKLNLLKLKGGSRE
jgi:ATP-dependent Clp protease, protease subunit